MKRLPKSFQRSITAPFLALGLLVSACAPMLQPMGPATLDPHVTSETFVTPDGVKLPMRRWEPENQKPRAAILALHGFNDYSYSFNGAGRFWAKQGFVTYAYDQRGFGEGTRPGIWAGVPTLVADLKAAATAVRASHPDLPLYVLGESMGGAVIIAALTDGEGFQDVKPAGIILSAPAVWARDTMPVVQRAALWVGLQTIPGVTLRPPADLDIQATDNIEILRALGRDPLVLKGSRVDTLNGLVNAMDIALAAAPRLKDTPPLLVLYGQHDEVVPPEAVQAFLDAVPPKDAGGPRIAMYEDGWHMLLRDLQAEVVMQDIAAWISNPSQPLPSGAEIPH